MNIPANDLSMSLQSQIEQAISTGESLTIRAGNSKDFYGRNTRTEKALDLSEHQGILSYEPSELVIKARTGTPIKAIQELLAENQQMMAFEPPAYDGRATLGGTLATNFSGPRRAYSGAVRDHVLGCKIINGKAETLSFGGVVMKNVAGYDVSRLMTGAMGTLGVLLEAAIKVVPKPETEMTCVLNISIELALIKLHQWANHDLPISASCYYQNRLYIRLSGTEQAIIRAGQTIGGEQLNNADPFWLSITEQTHSFFRNQQDLWRISIASNTPNLSFAGDTLYEWGGALRWLASDMSREELCLDRLSPLGHATLYRKTDSGIETFQSLPAPLLTLHKRLKQAFDPNGIFNPGRMYAEF